MEKFRSLTAVACPLALANVDTDQILPARFLKVPRAAGLGSMLMHDLRRGAAGDLRDDFPLNRPIWRDAKIIVAAGIFGSGSSREAAVYALSDGGIRCVVAPSFGDIFAQNCVKNGLLPAMAAKEATLELIAILQADPGRDVTVDLEKQTILCGNRTWPFAIDRAQRAQLLNGWDDVDLTKSYQAAIDEFKRRRRAEHEWSMPETR